MEDYEIENLINRLEWKIEELEKNIEIIKEYTYELTYEIEQLKNNK